MQRVNELEIEYRHGDWGVKYLMRGPHMEWGLILLKPGQSLGAHYHHQVEETFFCLQGTPLLMVDGGRHRVQEGEAFRLQAAERHDLVNDTDSAVKVVFIKAPYLPDDKVSC